MSRVPTCLAPMHKECRCCRPEGHEGACNCSFPWGPPRVANEVSLPDSLPEAEEHTDRLERFDDEHLAAEAGRAREALLAVVLGVLLAVAGVPASVWAALS